MNETQQDSTIKTTFPPKVWASSLARQERYHDLAMIFRPHSYHARTDTAETKRELATRVLLDAGAAAVDALMDTLTDGGGAITEIAELLIKIDDPKPAGMLRKFYETDQFVRTPAGIVGYLQRHLE